MAILLSQPQVERVIGSVYKHFSETLMKLTLSRGTIADACRALDMNRQQFNRYLAGKSLPSSQTLATLAEHFNITEAEFFAPLAANNDQNQPSTAFQGQSSPMLKLNEGVYKVYSPWVANQKLIFCGTIVVKNEAQVQKFRRYFNMKSTGSRMNEPAERMAEGSVLQNGYQTFLFGREMEYFDKYYITYALHLTNRTRDGEIPALATVWLPSNMPIALNVVLIEQHTLDETQCRQEPALVQATDEKLPPFVRQQFATPDRALLKITDAVAHWR